MTRATTRPSHVSRLDENHDAHGGQRTECYARMRLTLCDQSVAGALAAELDRLGPGAAELADALRNPRANPSLTPAVIETA